jgi:two-component system, OmpR family, sensor kinase
MSLARVRLRLTVVFGLVSALAVGILATLNVRSATARIEDEAEREAEQNVAYVLGYLDLDDLPSDEYDMWLVETDAGDEYVEPLGDTDVEPPLYSVASDAVEYGPTTEPFSQAGDDYLVHAQQYPDTTMAVVSAYWLGDTRSSISSLRLRIGLTAVGIVAGTSLVGFWFAGRSLRPARRALDQQRDFLANAAHELRTPIAVIQASASQALARPHEPDEYVHTLSEIRAAAERAGSDVADMLDLARLDAGHAVLRRAPLRLDLLVEEVAAAIDDDSGGDGDDDGVGYGATVEVQPAEATVIDADYTLLRKAVANVAQNAVRRAATVQLSVRVDGRDAVVEVADDGPGFAPDLLPRVFDRFSQGDRASDRGGSGIGLAIVRSIVEAHGGRAEAANRPEGGAVLRLHLPRTKP